MYDEEFVPVEEIKAVAKFWADKLRARQDQEPNTLHHQNVFAAYVVNRIEKNRPSLPVDKIDLFENAIVEKLSKGGWWRVDVGVDYDPDQILTEAAAKADIILNLGRLPWKTKTFIKPGKVEVREGDDPRRELVF